MNYSTYSSKTGTHYIIVQKTPINNEDIKNRLNALSIYRHIYVYPEEIDVNKELILNLVKTDHDVYRNIDSRVYLIDEEELNADYIKLKELDSLDNFYENNPEYFI